MWTIGDCHADSVDESESGADKEESDTVNKYNQKCDIAGYVDDPMKGTNIQEFPDDHSEINAKKYVKKNKCMTDFKNENDDSEEKY